jgi:hypothetical protein
MNGFRGAIIAILVCAWAMSGIAAEPPVKPTKLAAKDRVVALLQQTATALRSRSIEPHERPLFAELLTAADALAKDDAVPLEDRERWRGLARVRLGEGADVMRRQLAKKPANVRAPQTTLSQVLPQGSVAPGGKSADAVEAEALIELITGAVRPESWEDRGGQGVVRYWSLGHALIIRNTADVQEKVGGTVGLLRK